MQIFEIVPQVGVGSIALGTSRVEVKQCLGEPDFEDDRRLGSLSGFHIYLDDRDTVEFIELYDSPCFEAWYKGEKIHQLLAKAAVSLVQQDDDYDRLDPHDVGYSYIFKKLQLSLWRSVIPECEDDPEGGFFAAVGIGVAGYF